MKFNARKILGLFVQAFKNWQEDNCLRLSAALSYYSIFSIAPLLVIAISLAGLFLGAEAANDRIHNQMQGYVGSQAAEGIQAMVKSAAQPKEGALGTVIGIVTLLVGAAGVFGQLKDSLNTVWKVKRKPGGGVKSFIMEHFLSFGMVLGIGFLLLVSLLLTAFLSGMSGYFGEILQLPAAFWTILTFVGSFGVVTVLFATIFKILPDAEIEWKNVWVGAVATALLFELGKFGLGWYLGRPSTVSTYGAAGSVVLVLLWVYYASVILFYGAEFTRVYSKATGEAIQPAENAVSVETGPSGPSSAFAPAVETGAPSPFIPSPRKEHPATILAANAPLRENEGYQRADAEPILRPMAVALSIGAVVGVLLRFVGPRK